MFSVNGNCSGTRHRSATRLGVVAGLSLVFVATIYARPAGAEIGADFGLTAADGGYHSLSLGLWLEPEESNFRYEIGAYTADSDDTDADADGDDRQVDSRAWEVSAGIEHDAFDDLSWGLSGSRREDGFIAILRGEAEVSLRVSSLWEGAWGTWLDLSGGVSEFDFIRARRERTITQYQWGVGLRQALGSLASVQVSYGKSHYSRDPGRLAARVANQNKRRAIADVLYGFVDSTLGVGIAVPLSDDWLLSSTYFRSKSVVREDDTDTNTVNLSCSVGEWTVGVGYWNSRFGGGSSNGFAFRLGVRFGS